MRKLTIVILAVLLVTSFASSLVAEEEEAGAMDKEKTGCVRMMKKMMKTSLVATEDGGVIVMTGNRLLKYDKNLELKKETEIKMDIEGMQEKMTQMKEKCPVCKKD